MTLLIPTRSASIRYTNDQRRGVSDYFERELRATGEDSRDDVDAKEAEKAEEDGDNTS